jgi:RND family efflux transporter MFP subunit
MNDRLSSDLASLRIDRAQNPERRGPWRFLLGLVVVAGLGGGAYVYGVPALEARVFKTKVEVTEITVVSPAQASIELTSTGYVVPQRVSLVGAQIPGRVAKVHIVEGQEVKEGDVLIELDQADHRARVAAAQSQVSAARARAQTARASLAEARQNAERERRLVEAGVSPTAAAENLEARVKALDEQVKASDAEANAAQAEVNAISVNLQYLSIKSPMDGTIISKPPEVGELVGALTLEPLTVEIADFSSLVVESDVPEGRLHLVKMGAPTEIVLDAFPGKRYRGETLDVSPRVNRTKATVRVKVKFVDAPTDVLPDMSARVSFLQRALDEAAMKAAPKVVVPASAIAERNGAKVVFVLQGDQVRMQTVSLGPPFAGGFELSSGGEPGTRVIKNPAPDLADGQRVKQQSGD